MLVVLQPEFYRAGDANNESLTGKMIRSTPPPTRFWPRRRRLAGS